LLLQGRRDRPFRQFVREVVVPRQACEQAGALLRKFECRASLHTLEGS
jgi:hypothetical protein